MRNKWSPILIAVSVLALGILACSPPAVSPVVVTATPSAVTPTDTPPPGATDTPPPAGPTVAPPTDTPPSAAWLPVGTIALFAVGAWETPRLYAMTTSGAVDLGLDIGTSAVASPAGRWVAFQSRSPPSLVVTSMADGTTYIIPVTPGYDIFGITPQADEARMAFLELSGPDAEETLWAIVVVNLADGSTTRFATAMGTDQTNLPGKPIGWSASGELLLDTFLPFTEGNWGGVWGVALPPGAASAPLDTLSHREIIPGGGYLTAPHLSPDGARLVYLARNFDYVPSGYEWLAFDLAVNQLWTADVAGGTRTILLDVTDGGALARDAAWSPDGSQILFAQGTYSGEVFASLTFKVRDGAGSIRDVGAAPAGHTIIALDWCSANTALVVTMMPTPPDLHYLYTLDMTSGATSLVTSAQHVAVLGCVR